MNVKNHGSNAPLTLPMLQYWLILRETQNQNRKLIMYALCPVFQNKIIHETTKVYAYVLFEIILVQFIASYLFYTIVIFHNVRNRNIIFISG